MTVRARPPTSADLEAVYRIHADPETNRHNPAGPMRSRADARRRLTGWLADWRREGIGYWALESSGVEVVGFVGVRAVLVRVDPLEATVLVGREPVVVFNLYYRLAPVVWGQGLAAHFGREAVALARRDWPARPVIARMWPANVASERTARAAGLSPVGQDRDGRLVLADRPLRLDLIGRLGG